MVSLFLSEAASKSLIKMNDLSVSEVTSICSYFLHHLLIEKSDPMERTVVMKEEYLWAISTLFLEAAKFQTADDIIRSSLTDIGLSLPLVDMLVALYSENKANITKHLKETGINVPELVDVNWRLDYHVRSKVGGKENKPMFFVTLIVKDNGVLKEIHMLASHEQLQDFHVKMRDSIKQVDRLLNKLDSNT